MDIRKTDVLSYFLAVISGGLLFFSFPKFGTGWVAWVTLIPLLAALKDKSLKQSFALGWLAGLVGHVGILYWITYVVVQYGYLPLYMGIAAMLIVVAYVSLYTGLFAVGVRVLAGRGLPIILVAPVVWTPLEYVKSHILTGFPWENLGYSQYHLLPVIQIADVAGVYGVTFLIVFVNALLWNMGQSASRRGLKAVLGVVVMGAVIVYGLVRIDQVKEDMARLPVQAVSLVQGNVDQSVKWDPQFQQQTMIDYTTLTLQSATADKGLIVWPETAVPFFFQDIDNYHRLIIELAKKTNSWLLFGSPSYRKNEQGGLTLYNSAYLLSPHGGEAKKYDKMHLVPYGEYVPLRQIFPFISKLVQGVGDFGTGNGYIPMIMDGHRIGVLICYEGIFPEAGLTYKQAGADLLVNITNDAWFGRTSAPYQHLSMTVFRAIENRLYLVRAANTGITAFIDPLGSIVSQTGLFEKTSLMGSIRFMKRGTLYGIWGDAFVGVCGIVLAVLAMIVMIRRKKP